MQLSRLDIRRNRNSKQQRAAVTWLLKIPENEGYMVIGHGQRNKESARAKK